MSSPRVSIGVPVYNGQRYIRYTLDSLLAQTYRELEIIVTDNCSTDQTPQIVQEYAAGDSRVKYVRNPVNLGPARNYNRSLELAAGEYFKWNPADDLCAEQFIEKCVAVMEADRSVVLAYPRTTIIDSEGQIVGNYEYELDFDDPRPHVRLLRMMCVDHRLHGAHEMYGLIRTHVLRRAGGLPSHVRGDSVLLARLALAGRFRRIEEHLFYNRDHSARSSKYLSRLAVRRGSRLSRWIGCGPLPSAEWWDPKLRGRIVFPEWRVWREYVRAVQQADLPVADRLACWGALGLYTFRHVPKLTRDVLIAIEQLVNLMLQIADNQD